MNSQEPESPFAGRITKAEINDLPLVRYEGRIEMVRDEASLDAAVEALQQETVLGFDTESRPSFRRGQNFPPSLVQLAGEEAAYLFQIGLLGGLGRLRVLLADPGIIKAGVALKDDVSKLRAINPFEPAGFVELAQSAQKLGIVNTGLRSLAAILLGKRISKSAQTSNWSKEELTPAQIIYAATDAWIGRELYCRLAELVPQELKPVTAFQSPDPA